MANEQGRYIGETVTVTIGANVGLGQVLYCRTYVTGNPDVDEKGVWFPASCDEINEVFIQPGLMPRWAGANQLGVALEAATASTITSTQSGTQIPVLLNGYYSPGYLRMPGQAPDPLRVGYFATMDGAACGSPLYLLPGVLSYPATSSTASGIGGFSCFQPTYYGATQGVYRVLGYAQDLNFPYVVKFEPDKTWIEI